MLKKNKTNIKKAAKCDKFGIDIARVFKSIFISFIYQFFKKYKIK